MVDVFEKYNGRKIKKEYFEMVHDEFQELDNHYLYRFQFSATMETLIYMDKEKYVIQGVKIVKSTSSGRWSILTGISDNAAKTLDRWISPLLEAVET